MIWKPIPNGPRDLLVTYTYSPMEDSVEFEDTNAMFRDRPLKGMVLIESFCGDPTKGGCQLSHCWERAGGTAHRRDIIINPDHDFYKDDDYWNKLERRPAFAGQFAPECTAFSIAHTTPKIRSLANPVGNQADPEIYWSNLMLSRVVDRCLMLLSIGSHILIENPWLSYLWLIPEMLVLLGIP